MYWRKANHIHKWFVDNVQDGKDECHDAYVTHEQLQELLATCRQVQEDPSRAAELLPTQSGFFFGSTAYDEYYKEDVDATVDTLTSLLAEDSDADFYYRSSW